MKPSAQTSDLAGELLEFIRRKFYEGDNVQFSKDRRLLLEWVVLWPAAKLVEAGVTLPDDRLKEIFTDTIIQALQLGNTSGIKYRPAWLAKVIQSHFKIHWEEIYAEAKSARSLTEHNLLMVGRLPVASSPNSTAEMAAAARLLKTPKRKVKAPVKTAQSQLGLL